MTNTLIAPPSTRPVPLALVAGATFAGTLGFTALGTVLSAQSDEHGWSELAVIGGIALVAVLGVFAVVRRFRGSPKAGGVGLGLSLFGLLTVLAFFMGLTPAFAVGGLVLGASAGHQGRGARLGIAATAIGALALVGYVGIYVADALM